MNTLSRASEPVAPERAVQSSPDSYYGRPILKPHVWTPFVPWYFWIGGTTGAACVHGLIARIRGDDELAEVQRWVAFGGIVTSPVLLILDLGVRHRFLNMLRVFKPTSPMSVGSWVLSALGAAVTGSLVADKVLGAPALARVCDVAAAGLGPVLTTYTAVLVSNTATPVWHEAHAELPLVFASSGIAGAGACATAFAPAAQRRSARRMMIAGAIAMGVTAREMEKRLGVLGEPYSRGTAGAFKRASSMLALSGVALALIGRSSTLANRVAALLVAGAGVCERFAVLDAGKQSAEGPKYVVHQQRETLQNGERKPLR
ncbi:MAG TPA: NrfD/PsrC family molybdoenzyme membrane anchor subunit [Candidatus Baltobacteraceae bacterium]|nr:NrfD/PsrC family molybdoenzyme membrane anchor subunit [Candidatus Baltobacteraceae bacterium]